MKEYFVTIETGDNIEIVGPFNKHVAKGRFRVECDKNPRAKVWVAEHVNGAFNRVIQRS